MSRYVLPRLRDFIFIAIFAGALLTGQRMLNLDSDLGRHLTLGNYILDTHQIPTRDLLSFTRAGQPRPPYEWLAQVIFTLTYRLLNLDGVVLLTAFLIAASIFLVYVDTTERSNAPIFSLILSLWAAAASSLHWLTRPHVFSFIFFVVWVSWLEKVRTNKQFPIWLFPILMLIWANTHGGFIFGFLAWAAYTAGWLWGVFRKSTTWRNGMDLIIIGATSLLASMITPSLWGNWLAVLNNRSVYILSHTSETMPPNFATPNIWPFAGLLGIAVIVAGLRIKHIKPEHVFLLAGIGTMSLLMARNIPFFAFAAVPILGQWVKEIFSTPNYWLKLEDGFSNIDNQLSGFLWSAAAIAIAISFFAYHTNETHTSIYQFSPQVFPVDAVNWLESHPVQGNMYTDFNWGGYLLYRLWPTQHVFIDSQSDFYGEQFTRQYADILNGAPKWGEELAQYNVTWMIVPKDAGIAQAAESDPNWQIIYQDSLTIIFERK